MIQCPDWRAVVLSAKHFVGTIKSWIANCVILLFIFSDRKQNTSQLNCEPHKGRFVLKLKIYLCISLCSKNA